MSTHPSPVSGVSGSTALKLRCLFMKRLTPRWQRLQNPGVSAGCQLQTELPGKVWLPHWNSQPHPNTKVVGGVTMQQVCKPFYWTNAQFKTDTRRIQMRSFQQVYVYSAEFDASSMFQDGSSKTPGKLQKHLNLDQSIGKLSKLQARCCLARLLERASHVQRLCPHLSGPGSKFSHPVSCCVSICPVNKCHKKDNFSYLTLLLLMFPHFQPGLLYLSVVLSVTANTLGVIVNATV